MRCRRLRVALLTTPHGRVVAPVKSGPLEQSHSNTQGSSSGVRYRALYRPAPLLDAPDCAVHVLHVTKYNAENLLRYSTTLVVSHRPDYALTVYMMSHDGR